MDKSNSTSIISRDLDMTEIAIHASWEIRFFTLNGFALVLILFF